MPRLSHILNSQISIELARVALFDVINRVQTKVRTRRLLLDIMLGRLKLTLIMGLIVLKLYDLVYITHLIG